jgi:hypothetical protein
MGIKGFSKTFTSRVIKQKDLKDLTGALDASVILYQSCLGMQSVKGLTDSSGTPTLHINVIIARVLNFIKGSVGQVWVFDYHEHGYTSPDKEIELDKRRKRKIAAAQKIADLKKNATEKNTTEKNATEKKSGKKLSQDDANLFTDSDDDDEVTEKKINQQEKITFSMNEQVVNDCKFILDSFDICWCVSSKGNEAEQICAKLTLPNDLDFMCDFTFSTDVDTLLYGSKQLVRSVKSKGKKVLQLYELETLLADNDIGMDDLQKIGIILGSDHAPKTPRVGPKSVLRKFKDVVLTEAQIKGVDVFNKTIDLTKIEFHNELDEVEVCSDETKINKLLDWIESKNFNRDRIKNQILKVNPELELK